MLYGMRLEFPTCRPLAQALAAEQTTKKRARKEARAVPDTLPPLPDTAAEGARKISTAIEKNRGLTPHRAKAGKNPRKKNRTKFEKAQVRNRLSIAASAAIGGPFSAQR